MTRAALAACLALATGFARPVAAAESKPATPSSRNIPPEWKSWYEPAEPVRIAGPIYYVGTKGLAVYLITTPSGHFLLDGAMPEAAPLIEDSIRRLGFKPEEIRVLLNTHAHVDHAGTLAHFKALSGARLVAMKPDDRLLKSGGRSDYLYADDPDFHFPPVVVDHLLEDMETVTLGDVTMTARHTPGHTRGSTTWFVSVDDNGRTYQVVFPASTSVNPGTRLLRKASYRGIADDYRHSFSVLASLPVDIFLTAHPGFMDFDAKRARAATEGAAAFVDPEGYRRLVAEGKERFEKYLADETAGKPAAGEAAAAAAAAKPAAPAGLAGTAWKMVRFQGGDDTIVTPDDPAKYTLQFGADGGVSVRFDCNRGRGAWKTSGASQLELGPLALTRALCPPGSLHDRLVKDWGFVRSYVLKDGRLFLSLMADGGIYEFEPL